MLLVLGQVLCIARRCGALLVPTRCIAVPQVLCLESLACMLHVMVVLCMSGQHWPMRRFSQPTMHTVVTPTQTFAHSHLSSILQAFCNKLHLCGWRSWRYRADLHASPAKAWGEQLSVRNTGNELARIFSWGREHSRTLLQFLASHT